MSTSDRPLIQLTNVHKTFNTAAGQYNALKGINLTFSQGEFTSIMGKSGSGKSTLLNMVTGIDHPTSGVVRIGDEELHRMNESQMAVWRGRNLGIVFQFFQLLPTLTILENTLLPMDYGNIYPPAEREPRALELLRMLDLSDMADKLPAALSGGQQQIAAIARSLANDPPILVADEPTGNLDSRTAERVLDIFNQLALQGKTILIVTHDSSLARRSTRRVLICDGELVNEHIAHALPSLSHVQLLKLTKLMTPRRYETGVTVARQGALDAGLFVLTGGRVDILRQGEAKSLSLITTLLPGQYFSNLELLETELCDLTFRVTSDGPVDILCLPLAQFDQWLVENPSAENALRRSAAERSGFYCPQPRARPQEPRVAPFLATSYQDPLQQEG